MNGAELLSGIMEDLERAKELIEENSRALEQNNVSPEGIRELISDIERDRGRYYDLADAFAISCEDIEVE